jgi:uncharacterized protein (DUF1697 family)
MCHALSDSASTQSRDLQSKFYGRFDTFSIVVIRTAKELGPIISGNPFPKAKPEQVGVMLFVDPIPKGIFKDLKIAGPEKVEISGREIYIHFPNGMGRSKLKFPDMPQKGIVRNINTITKLAELSRDTLK